MLPEGRLLVLLSRPKSWHGAAEGGSLRPADVRTGRTNGCLHLAPPASAAGQLLVQVPITRLYGSALVRGPAHLRAPGNGWRAWPTGAGWSLSLPTIFSKSRNQISASRGGHVQCSRAQLRLPHRVARSCSPWRSWGVSAGVEWGVVRDDTRCLHSMQD